MFRACVHACGLLFCEDQGICSFSYSRLSLGHVGASFPVIELNEVVPCGAVFDSSFHICSVRTVIWPARIRRRR